MPVPSVCSSPVVTVNVVDRGSADSHFASKVVNKQKSAAWWEHEITFKISTCAATNMHGVARRLARYMNLSNTVVSHNAQVGTGETTVTLNLKTRDKYDLAYVEKSSDKACKMFMQLNHSVTNMEFKIQAEKKEKVTTFPQWQDVDQLD